MKLYDYSIKRTFIKEIKTEYVNMPDKAAEAIRARIDFEREQEQLIVLFLNGRNNITGSCVCTIGTLDASLVHPREVFKPAIINSSAAVILGHNHPSGEEKPSQTDIQVSKKIKEAGKLLGIPCLDFIIVTEDEHFSFKEEGLI